MNDPSGTKRLMTALFVVIGLPAGLCSLYVAPTIIGMLRDSDSQAYALGVLFGAPVLVGFVIFAILLALLIRAWRREA